MNKMRVNKDVISILLMAMAMLLNACSSDDSDAGADATMTQVQVIAYAPQYIDKEASTRAVPSGFSAYTPDRGTTMGMYVLQAGDTAPYAEKRLRYNSSWSAYFDVLNNTEYTVYGFMPKAEGMTSSLTGVTANGATLTITGVKPVTTDDICVITGVNDTEANLKEGIFNWYHDVNNANFYMYLLMDHVFASVKFSMKIDANFAKIRSIKLKTMTLNVNKGSGSVTVPLTHNTTGASPVGTVTYAFSGTEDCQSEIFNNTEGLQLSSTPTDITACFAPTLSDDLTLVSTYDVYDSKGNLIRQNCTATNKLPNLNAQRGERVQLNITVNPTYLYVLSDKDLDNLFVIQ